MRTIKNLIMLVIMLAPALAIAQGTEIRKVESFNQIRVEGSFNVFVNSGNEESVKIQMKEGDPEKVITEAKKGLLKVYIEKGYERNIRATVYITYKEVKSIELAGSGDLVCQSAISADNFTLSSAGSGTIVVNNSIKAKDLEIANSGSGNMKLAAIEATNFDSSIGGSGNVVISSGQVQTADISLAGSGSFKALEVKTDNCSISTSGSSNVEITVEQTLEIAASGSSEIRYKGNAQLTKVSTSGSAEIIKVN